MHVCMHVCMHVWMYACIALLSYHSRQAVGHLFESSHGLLLLEAVSAVHPHVGLLELPGSHPTHRIWEE